MLRLDSQEPTTRPLILSLAFNIQPPLAHDKVFPLPLFGRLRLTSADLGQPASQWLKSSC